jgi:hypothetical protein
MVAAGSLEIEERPLRPTENGTDQREPGIGYFCVGRPNSLGSTPLGSHDEKGAVACRCHGLHVCVRQGGRSIDQQEVTTVRRVVQETGKIGEYRHSARATVWIELHRIQAGPFGLIGRVE